MCNECRRCVFCISRLDNQTIFFLFVTPNTFAEVVKNNRDDLLTSSMEFYFVDVNPEYKKWRKCSHSQVHELLSCSYFNATKEKEEEDEKNNTFWICADVEMVMKTTASSICGCVHAALDHTRAFDDDDVDEWNIKKHIYIENKCWLRALDVLKRVCDSLWLAHQMHFGSKMRELTN